MGFLVIGGTGTVGSEVVRGLVGRGDRVRVLTRSAAKAGRSPRAPRGPSGTWPTRRVCGGRWRESPASSWPRRSNPRRRSAGWRPWKRSGRRGSGGSSTCRCTGWTTVPTSPTSAASCPSKRRSAGWVCPSLSCGRTTSSRTISWFGRPSAQYGVYPQPIGPVGLSRVDVRDIAHRYSQRADRAWTRGSDVPLVGPDVLTGEATAAVYSRHLGREIRYGGDDLDAWTEQVRAVLPDWQVRDLRVMYEHFQHQGLVATDADLAAVPSRASGASPAGSKTSPPSSPARSGAINPGDDTLEQRAYQRSSHQ